MTGRREEGFTLLELIIAITITGIILVVVTMAVSASFTHTTTARTAIDRSRVTNFAARYFAADIASSSATPDTTTGCGSGTTALRIPLDATTAAYMVVTSGDGSTSLVRRLCSGTSVTSERALGRTRDPFTATGSCGTTTCTLTVSWSEPAQSFSVRGERRVTTQ